MFMVKRAKGYNIDHDMKKNVESTNYPMSSGNLPHPEETKSDSPEKMYEQVLVIYKRDFSI